MDEQRIQVTNIPLFPVVGREWIMISVCFVKGPFKASEQRGHGQVHASMAVINGRIYQYGPAMLITKEIAAPQVAMQKGRRFGRKDAAKGPIEVLKLLNGMGV